MSLNELALEINSVNRKNGWFDESRDFGDDVALLHSEVSEMYEEYRNGHLMFQNYYTLDKNGNSKPEGIPSELADIIIRALDTGYRLKLDIDAIVREKLEYNRTRGYRHGDKKV